MWTNPPTLSPARQADFDRLVEFLLTWGVMTRQEAEERALRCLMDSDLPAAPPEPSRPGLRTRKFYPPRHPAPLGR